MKQLFRSTEVKVLLGVFVAAIILRVFALNYGLPNLYLEDEEFFVQPALKVAVGDLDPYWYGAPAQTLIYVTAAIFRVTNKILNIVHGTTIPVQVHYEVYTSVFQTAARAFPALIGALSIFPAFLIVSRWGKRAGVFAAALIAASYYLVDESHIIRPDVLQTFFVLWMVYFGIRIIEAPRRWFPYVMFAVSFGLGVATKYPTLFFLVPIVIFVIVLWKAKKLQPLRWLTASVISVATTFATGPYLFLNFQRVLHDVEIENRAQQAGHDLFNWGQNIWWYCAHVLQYQLGTFMGILVIGVIVLCLKRMYSKRSDTRPLVILALFATSLLYIAILSFLHLHWERWAMPSLVLLVLIAGVGIDYLLRIRSRWLAAAAIVLLLVAPTLRLARTMYGFAHAETRGIARAWVLDTIPTGSGVVVEPYTPELPASEYSIFGVPNLSWNTHEEYLEWGASYFLISEYIHGRIASEAIRLGPSSDFGKATVRYNSLLQKSKKIYSARPHPQYSSDQLIASNDFSVMRTFDIAVFMGPAIDVYSLE